MWLKICGVQSEKNARRLARLSVDALGINRVESSSRYVRREQARGVAREIRRENSSIEVVGVYVDAPEETILRDRETIGLDTAQLHGEESPEDAETLMEAMGVIKAFRVGEDFSPDRLGAYSCRRKLLDAYHPQQQGGTGEPAPWQRIRQWTGTYRIVLAGGLTPDNVTEAISTVRPWGLDVCSGVENESGLKDLDAATSLIEKVKKRP